MAKAKEEKKEVAVKEEAGLPAIMSEMEKDGLEASGMDDISSKDCAIPFLSILQSNSPQLQPGTKIEGASIGDLFNTVTNELIKAPVDVVACAFKHCIVEWRPDRGGFVRQHDTDEMMSQTKKNEKGKDILPNGNELVNTDYQFVLLKHSDGRAERSVIAFTSTQIKKSRKWNSQKRDVQFPNAKGKMFHPPVYGVMYSLNTVPESNKLGHWMGFNISNPRIITDAELYARAKAFRAEVVGGKVDITPPASEAAEVAEPTGSENVM